MKKQWLWIVGMVLGVTMSQANIITDPGGLDTLINSNGLTMEEEAGNISVAAFNALPLRYAFTFEEDDGYPAPDSGNPASRVDRIEFNDTVNDFGQRVDFASTGFRLTSTFRPTGGDNDLVLQAGSTLTITMTNAVQGIAFTANRVDGTNLTVRLFSDTSLTTQIGSDFAIQDNTGGTMSERSFFGFYDGAENIQAVQIIGTGAQQYGIDDLNIAVIPEPGALPLLLLGASLLVSVFRRR